MTDLNLAELDLRERRMPRLQGHVWITQENVDYIGDSLRPLLTMVEKMGDLLIDIRAVNFTRSDGLGDLGLEKRTDELIRSYKGASGGKRA